MDNLIKSENQIPCLIERDGVILELNELFMELTGFDMNELINKETRTLWKELFRNNIETKQQLGERKAFIFTKSLDLRYITVQCYQDNDGRVVHRFIEEPNSRLDDKLQFFNRLIEDNKIGIAIYTVDGFRLVKANQVYLNYLPCPYNTREVVYGISISDFLPGFKGGKAEKVWTNIIKMNQSLYFTEKQGLLHRKDNSYWDNNIIPLTVDGEVKYIVTTLEDVTERVLSREHLRIKNQQLEAIFESVSENIQIVDKYGKYVMKSNNYNSFLKSFDESKLEAWGKYLKVYDGCGTEIQSKDFTVNKVLSGEKIENRQVAVVCNGRKEYIDVSGKPIFDEQGEVLYGILTTRNITKEVERRELINEKNKELEVIIDNMHDGLAVIDKNGKYIKFNNALKEIMLNKIGASGIYTEIGESAKFGQVYYDEYEKELDVNDFPASRVLRGEEVKNQRVILKHGTEKIYLDYNGTPVYDENGSFKYGIILTHDVTHQIEKESEARRQQEALLSIEREKRQALEDALAMKDEFLSLVSHEFKTPLNVIYSALQLIEHSYISKVPDRVKELIGNIKQNTFRQLRLVNNLLDITKLNSGRFNLNIRNVDIVLLTEVIANSIKLYAEQKDIKILFKSYIKSKIMGLDDEKYERILLNLLSNAIKFTPEGGVIFIELDEERDSEQVIISVADTGIGIPKDKQDLIFERFGQVDSELSRRAEGTGIGLSLVKLLVEAFGGTIELQSELGRGSTFIIKLPSNAVAEDYKAELCLDIDSRLINAINVEFSDIYF